MSRVVVFLLCLIFLNPSMAALDEEAAESLVHDFFSTTRSIVNSGKPESEIWDDFNALVGEYCDIPWISGLVLGSTLGLMSRDQKVGFVIVYRARLVDKLMEYAFEFNKYEIEVLRVRKSGNIYVVSSELQPKRGYNTSSIEWQISDRKEENKPRIHNLRYEGILLSSAERRAMKTILNNHNGDIDGFIEELQSKADRAL